MALKDVLPKLRQERGLTQEELAKKLYITRQAVSRWETGETTPGIDMTKLLAFTLEVPITDLLEMPEQYCQSCGMMFTGPDQFGHEADGSETEEFCRWCYDKGEYTYETTMEDMIEECAPRMAEYMNWSVDECASLLGAVLPTLKRWKQIGQMVTEYEKDREQSRDTAAGQVGVKKRAWPKRLGITLLVLIVIVCAAFYAYTSDYYHAGETATEMMGELADSGQLQESESGIAIGDSQAQTGIILYPGAKVDPVSYVPLAYEFAQKGYYCVIAKMPFNLVFFGIDEASELMDAAPGVDSWWLAGHSLGGAMGASYASSHRSELQGMIFLAAYSTNDLSTSGLRVVCIYGSNDGVLNRDALVENESNLPQGSMNGSNRWW